MAAASISIFSREALLAFGVVYWFHSIYQVVLTATLYVLLLAVAGPRPIAWWKFVLLSLLCFAGAWIEWTGFTFNLGAAVILLIFARGRDGLVFLASLTGASAIAAAIYAIWRSKVAGVVGAVLVGGSILIGLVRTYRRSREIAMLAACMMGSTVLAALVIVSHYASIVDLPTLTWRMRARLEARSAFAHGGTLDNILLLVQGYGLSFGPFLLVLALCAIYLWNASIEPGAKRILILMLLVATIPLSENIVLMENSGEFSYARLKFVVPASMIIAVALAYSHGARRAMLAAAVALACVLGYWTYREDLTFYASWRAIDAKNKAFRDSLKADPEFDCSVLVTKAITRGYGTLLFHRMIFETWAFPNATSERESLSQAIASTSACQGIYLRAKLPNSTPPFTNMAEYTGALILTKGGQTRIVEAPDANAAQVEPSWYVKLFSYRGRLLLDR
jgi:hypothetical protein